MFGKMMILRRKCLIVKERERLCENGRHRTARMSLNHLYARRRHVGLAHAFEGALKGNLTFAQIQKEDLILVSVHQRLELAFQLEKFPLIELANEDAVLDMIAVIAQRLKDLRPPFVVGYIIADQVMSTWHMKSPCCEPGMLCDIAAHPSRQQCALEPDH